MIKIISAKETHNLRQTVLGENISDYQYIYESDENSKILHFGSFENDVLVGVLTAMKSKYIIR